MNYEEEKKRYISFCGSYCRTCDWFTGRIRRTFQIAFEMVELYGFQKFFQDQINIENFKKGLSILASTPIDSGCKADIAEKPEEDRCKIRQCCHQKDLDLCDECQKFPCKLLANNPGVIKFHCIENLQEIKTKGLKPWVDKQIDLQLSEYIKG
ncbi:MAG: DUF3795 domain-containing protein [Candidatus Thorarchaeota archaeon]